MKKKLVIFTSEFPFGVQETFFESELPFLAKEFSEIELIPLFRHKSIRSISFSNVSTSNPVFSDRGSSLEFLITFFSLTFWKAFLLSMIDCKFNFGAIKKSLKQALIVKTLKLYLAKRKDLFDSDCWYFYWGTNSINILSFLKAHPKVVARFHRYDLLGPEIAIGGEWQPLQQRTLKHLDLILTVSKHGLEYLKNKYVFAEERIKASKLGVIDNGLNSASSDDILRIATCSNIYPVKRLDRLAHALSRLNNMKIEWFHIGDGEESEKKKIIDISKQFDKLVTLNFVGRKSNSEVMDFYKNNSVDLFINTSEIEGVPVSIMEALSFGIPVIATNVGGTSELVDSTCGHLISSECTVDELSNSIKIFHKNHFKSSLLRANARQAWNSKANATSNYEDLIMLIRNLLDENQ